MLGRRKPQHPGIKVQQLLEVLKVPQLETVSLEEAAKSTLVVGSLQGQDSKAEAASKTEQEQPLTSVQTLEKRQQTRVLTLELVPT